MAEASSASASRLSGTCSHAMAASRSAGGAVSARMAEAPAASASLMKRWPSARVPRMAANSTPGAASREEAVRARTSVSIGPEAVTRERRETSSRRIIVSASASGVGSGSVGGNVQVGGGARADAAEGGRGDGSAVALDLVGARIVDDDDADERGILRGQHSGEGNGVAVRQIAAAVGIVFEGGAGLAGDLVSRHGGEGGGASLHRHLGQRVAHLPGGRGFENTGNRLRWERSR